MIQLLRKTKPLIKRSWTWESMGKTRKKRTESADSGQSSLKSSFTFNLWFASKTIHTLMILENTLRTCIFWLKTGIAQRFSPLIQIRWGLLPTWTKGSVAFQSQSIKSLTSMISNWELLKTTLSSFNITKTQSQETSMILELWLKKVAILEVRTVTSGKQWYHRNLAAMALKTLSTP